MQVEIPHVTLEVQNVIGTQTIQIKNKLPDTQITIDEYLANLKENTDGKESWWYSFRWGFRYYW